MGIAAAVLSDSPQDHAVRLRRNKRKYVPTQDVDELIRAAYLKQRQGNRLAIKSASYEIGWPRYAVARRGAELGVTRVKERAWSASEEDLLERHGHLPVSSIRLRLAERGFNRSCAAIQVKVTRLRIKRNLDGYSACALALGFGVDVHKILLWIRRGLLSAERRGTSPTSVQGGDSWWITRDATRRFIMRAPEEIDLARVEKLWFLDLVTNGRICR